MVQHSTDMNKKITKILIFLIIDTIDHFKQLKHREASWRWGDFTEVFFTHKDTFCNERRNDIQHK